MAKTCERCETPLTGRQRRFCSGRCRSRWHEQNYRATCPRCGDPMGVGSLHRDFEFCGPCRREREAMAHRARIEDVAEMYREGMTMREISATLGNGPNSIPHEVHEAFRLGILRQDEHRYDATRREAMRLGREAAKAA